MSAFEVLSIPINDANGYATTLGDLLVNIEAKINAVSVPPVDSAVLSAAVAAGVKAAMAQLTGTVTYKEVV